VDDKETRQEEGRDDRITRRELLRRLGNYSVVAAGVLAMSPNPARASRARNISQILQLLLFDDEDTPAFEFEEDFESGDFSKYPWVQGGDAPWYIVSDEKYEGSYCARSGNIGQGRSSSLQITLTVPIGKIYFYRKVYSEASYDFLNFYIDGELKNAWSGHGSSFTKESFPVSAGQHTFKWEYKKDGSVSDGADCAWIDKVYFIPSQDYGDWSDWSGDWSDYSDWDNVYSDWTNWSNVYQDYADWNDYSDWDNVYSDWTNWSNVYQDYADWSNWNNWVW